MKHLSKLRCEVQPEGLALPREQEDEGEGGEVFLSKQKEQHKQVARGERNLVSWWNWMSGWV